MTVLDRCLFGDCREVLRDLPSEAFRCCVTSPPYYGLRDYGHPLQIGIEDSPDAFAAELVAVFGEVRRTLASDGTLWLVLGDCFAKERSGSLKRKDLIGIPWIVAFALRADGWYLRSDTIWSKPNPMPESITDRPTRAHEYVFLLSKSETYFYDQDALREPHTMRPQRRPHGRKRDETPRLDQPRQSWSTAVRHEPGVDGHPLGRNARSVWEIATEPYDGAHSAAMPQALARRCISAGSAVGDAVLDPFFGTGTVGRVAEDLGRRWLGIELNPDYAQQIAQRTAQIGLKIG